MIIWLVGDIDSELGPTLDDVAHRVRAVTGWLTIDGSRLTFADSTLLRFLAITSEQAHVVIRRPSRIFRDILAVSGLADRVLIIPTESETQ